MIRFGLRLAPAHGRHDLAWLAEVTGSLHEIHEFLLREEIGARLAAEENRRALSPEETRLVIDGRATEIGSPLVTFGDDPALIQLAARASPAAAQTLTWLTVLLEQGPELAMWPGHLKRAWFGDTDTAARAKQAYAWLMRSLAADAPEAPKPLKVKGSKKGKRQADLPSSVRRAAPLTG